MYIDLKLMEDEEICTSRKSSEGKHIFSFHKKGSFVFYNFEISDSEMFKCRNAAQLIDLIAAHIRKARAMIPASES